MHENNKMQTMSETMGRVTKRERKELFVSRLQNTVSKVAISLIPTIIIGSELIKYTLEERGYFAIGGEWILMIMIFIAAYGILDKKKATH